MRRRPGTMAACIAALTLVASAQSIREGQPADERTARDVMTLHAIDRESGQGYGTMPAQLVIAVRDRLQRDALGDLAVVGIANDALELRRSDDPDDAVRLVAAEMTFNALELLGIAPYVGRRFVESDVGDGVSSVALLTAATWQRHFNSRPEVVGTRLWRRSGGDSVGVTIVGVLPAGIFSVAPELDPDTEVFTIAPHRFASAPSGERWFAPLVRLRTGVSLADAHRAINDAFRAASRTLGESPRLGARLDTLRGRRGR